MMKQLTMRSILMIVFAAAAFPLAALGQHVAHDLTYVDRQFIKDAVAYNEAEIIAARAQSEHGWTQSIRDYADRTLRFYLDANGRLEAIAKEHDVKYTTYGPNMPSVHVVSPQEYMKQQAARHQHVITLYEHQVKNGTNMPLRQYALDIIPGIKSQLAMEQQYLAAR